MGGLFSIFCCACQAISCACSLASCCFGSATGKTGIDTPAAKLFYIIMLGISTVLAFSLKYTGGDWGKSMGPFSVSMGCTNTSFAPGYDYSVYGAKAQGYCVGDAAVYRISLALTIFYGFLMLFSGISEALFKGFWFFKIMIFVGGLFGCFFIPEIVFAGGGFQWVARIASSIFLVLQILILIDFGYNWNEKWVANAFKGSLDEEPTSKCWLILILASAVFLYVLTFSTIILTYIYYGSACQDVQAIVSVTLILILIFTVIALYREQLIGVPGSVLPSAVVSAYAAYLTWAGVESNPNALCKPAVERSQAVIWVGILIAALSLMWTSFNASSNTENLMRGEDEPKPAVPAEGQALYRVEENGQTKNVSDLESNKANRTTSQVIEPKHENLVLFFVLLMAASLYMSMLLTNWGEASSDIVGATGLASMWVKIISAWLAMLLYIWTLVAPAVCKGREFS